MEQIEVAKGIGEFGMLAVTAAFFLVFSTVLMSAFVRFFIKLINGIVEKQENIISELLSETRSQNEYLSDIKEGLKDETVSRIKILSSSLFENSKEEVCRLIKKVRDENHISDRGPTSKKIRMLLEIIHQNRNSKLDSFTFRGRRLSSYTSIEWIERVASVFESEIYSEKINNGRAYTNISTVYEDIKLEFYHNLNPNQK